MKSLILPLLLLCFSGEMLAQIGIGVNVPNSKSMLEIKSTTKGFLPPRMTTAQRVTLGASLTKVEKGMIVLDSLTSKQFYWDSAKWTNTIIQPGRTVKLISDSLMLNPGTAAGDLLSWDGVNWINKQPAPAHFTYTLSSLQPYLALNYCISLYGIYPSQNDLPFIGEIRVFGFNFNPLNWANCDGQLLPIAQFDALFSLIGTIYGGDGQTTFALPDLRGRKPIHQGNGALLTPRNIGESGGSETLIINQ